MNFVERIVEQKEPIKLLCYDHEQIPKFTDQEWKVIESCVEVMQPIAETVKELQNRRECMSYIIPNFLVC